MINLEWLRTFRAVYRTKSLSQAAEMLSISQPTVSQQISTLEAHLGHKLFIRKSKGVLETDEGKMLNTMISGSIETLEAVIEHYQTGGKNHLHKSTLIQPLNLTDIEKQDLVAFLKTLTDKSFVNNPLFRE